MAAVFFSGAMSYSVPAYGAGEKGALSLNAISENAGNENSGSEEKAGEIGTDEANEGSLSKNSETGTELSGNIAAGETVSGNSEEQNTESANSISGDEAAEVGNVMSTPVPEPSEFLPLGALDDETPIDSPEPIPEFQTTLTEQEETDASPETDRPEVSLFSSSHTASVLSMEEGDELTLPDSQMESEPAAGAADYSVSYNSLNEGYLPTGYTINQGNSSLCWAYTASMLTDISMIKNGYKAQNEVRYSADQIGYFFFNRVDDPLGNTPDDKNIIIGSDYYNRGGNNSFNTWSLASWISPRDYDDLPFKNEKYTDVSADKAYDSAAHMQNAYWTSLTASENDISYITNVKELIHDHGGVSVIIYSKRNINSNHAVYGTTASGGHNVSFVGWDDNYPKENFTVTPPGDGAWYVRDSYDGNGNIDENGGYWMSYYDRSITYSASAKAIAFDFERGDNYDRNYQYDGAAGNRYVTSGGADLRISNVFRAASDEYLKAVSFAPKSVSMSYTVNIYKLSEGYSSPVGTESLSTASGETRFTGYRTVVLDKPVRLHKGDIFSVVFDLKDTSGYNKAQVFVDSTDDKGASWVRFESGVSEKQSYIVSSDTASAGYSIRIKAFSDIVSGSIENCSLSPLSDVIYNGSRMTPSVTVTDIKGNKLMAGTDYELTYGENLNIGQADVTVTGKGTYEGQKTLSFKILPADISGFEVSGIKDIYAYTGSPIEPEAVIKDNRTGRQLVKGTDYTVSCNDNLSEGEGTITLTGKGNYTGSVSRSFFISAAEKKELKISKIPDQTFVPGGEGIRPAITVKDGSLTLNADSDYSVSFTDNLNAGQAKVKVTGVKKTVYDNSSAEAAFTIKPFSIKNAVLSGVADRVYEEGHLYEVSEKLTVVSPKTGKTVLLKRGTDYKVSYENNTGIKPNQQVKVYIDGINNYQGRITRTFRLRSYIPISDPENFEISLSKDLYQYDGTAKKPEVTVTRKGDGRKLVLGEDFKVTYSSNKNAGTGKVTVKPTSGYSRTNNVKGSALLTFGIEGKKAVNVDFGSISDKTFTGKQIKPSLKVYENGKRLSGSDYFLEYQDNVNAGTATIIVHGRRNYSGVLGQTSFIIKKRKFNSVRTSYKKSTDVLTVRYGNAVLRENFDYVRDKNSRLITSLETNFEAGTKRY